MTVSRSVPNRDAGNVAALQRPTYGFRLIAVEAGEAGSKQLSVAFGDHRFGERISLVEQAVGLAARGINTLPGFAFALQRANLNDPSRVGGLWFDGTVLLNGLRLRLGAGGGIGVSHGLRSGGGRHTRCRQYAEYTVSGAVVRRLRRHFSLGCFDPGRFGLAGLGLSRFGLSHFSFG